MSWFDDLLAKMGKTSGSGSGSTYVGSKAHLLERYKAWIKAGHPPDRFLKNYNRNRDTDFTEKDLGGAVGTTQHMLERYDAWVSAGNDPDRFLVNYNRNRGTSFTASQLASVQTPGTGSTSDRDAYASLLDILDSYGLGSLAGWLWQNILDDVPEAEIFIKLRQTDQYKLRFPGMDVRRQNGLRALSEHEYIQAEEGYRTVLRGIGVSPSKYDNPDDFLDYFSRDISVDEAGERAELWRMMTKAPQFTARIKGMFKTFAKIGDVTDQQLFDMLVENDSALLAQLHDGMSQTSAISNLSMSNLKETIQKAIDAEAATFKGGGGRAAEQEGLAVGFTGSQTERFT